MYFIKLYICTLILMGCTSKHIDKNLYTTPNSIKYYKSVVKYPPLGIRPVEEISKHDADSMGT